MSNRVEDLESQVAELQATIDGLTEELVETKERVRQLEETAEQYEEAVQATPGGNGQSRQQESHAGSPEQSTAEQQAEARGTDERRDAQFVENRDPEPEPEPEPEVEVDSEEADDDDDDDGIIVA
jgi:uncharacterized coiled-coil protein SlyX